MSRYNVQAYLLAVDLGVVRVTDVAEKLHAKDALGGRGIATRVSEPILNLFQE